MAAYVYRHIRKDTEQVFYVGVGRDNPINKKPYLRARTRFGRNRYWKRVVNKAGFDWEIILDDLTPEEARQKEIEFIKLYGRVPNGPLVNLTAGGDGSNDPSDETRALMRAKRLGKSPANKGKPAPIEAIEKMKATKKRNGPVKQKPWTEERRKKQSEWNKVAMTGSNNPNFGRPRTEDTRRKISNANKGKVSANKGKPMAPKLYQKWNQKSIERRKPVLQYGTDKKFIAEHLSITHAVKAVGVTQSVLLVALKTNGRVKAGGYHWKHKISSDYPQELVVEKLIRKPNPKLSEKHKQALIKGAVAASRKLLVNVVTGVYYEGIGEASIAVCIKRTTLNAMLKGQNKNKTDLIYA